jgi:hypothetical protein
MPDIFGKEPRDYEWVRYLQSENLWDPHQRALIDLVRFETNVAVQPHDFNAIGTRSQMQQRAIEDQTALGFLTNNLLSIQSAADEIMYTAYRLPEFVSLNTNIPIGSSEYGVRVRDRVGRADRVSSPGYDAPSATVSQGLTSRPLHYYGLDAEWSIQEIRGAQMTGVALDTESIEAAVMGSLETMEAVAFTGGGFASATGLVNQPTTGTGTDVVRVATAPFTFAGGTAEQVRIMVTTELSKVIENSAETLGRNINTGMTVYLPGTQYDSLNSKYLGDNAERTVMRGLMEDNPWTYFTNGSPLMIMRLLELDAARNPGSTNDRMITTLKHPRIAELGVSIMPRVLKIEDKGRVITAQVESEYSELWVKRPQDVYYLEQV